MRTLAAQIKVHPDSYIEELRYDNATNVIQRTTYIRGEKKRISEACLNVEHDGYTLDGRPTKVKTVSRNLLVYDALRLHVVAVVLTYFLSSVDSVLTLQPT
jgi:hypothetical protein